MGLIKAASNANLLVEKNKKLAAMGVQDIDNPILGETYVELSLHFVYRNEDEGGNKTDQEQLFLYVEADDAKILTKKSLEKVIGTTDDHFWQTHFPYNTWADDLEKQDFWSDAVADIVRTPNKVLNSWFSQLVENRTLRNFGMHYFNSNLEGFTPEKFNPMPWGWYGIPVPEGGDLRTVMQKVDIPDLSESLDEMGFIVTMLEKATGATATQQGVQTANKTTLGEVQLALGEAKERVKGMSKFYTAAWKARGEMFYKLIEAASDKLDAVKIYKKGRITSDIYSREIEPKNWMTKSGYRCKVWSQDEKTTMDSKNLEKLNVAKMSMPDNPKLTEIFDRKIVEFAGLTPDEVNDVMDFEKKKQEAMMSMPQLGMGGVPTNPMGQPVQPVKPPVPSPIQNPMAAH
jgi:hypothetical protein